MLYKVEEVALMTQITTDNIAEIDRRITDVCEGASQDLADLCSAGWLSEFDFGRIQAHADQVGVLPRGIRTHLDDDKYALSLILVGERMQEIANAIDEVMIHYGGGGKEQVLSCTASLRDTGRLE